MHDNKWKIIDNSHLTASTIKLFLFILFIFNILIACSTIKTDKQAYSYSTVTDKNSYQVRIRSGNIMLDSIIYDAATKEFGKYLHISGEESVTGFIDIIFICKAKRGITGSSPGCIHNVVYGNSWYTGDKTVNTSSEISSTVSGSRSVGMFNLQKSNMIVVIKRKNGQQFWGAQDAYNGVSDFSRLFVQTVDETAIFALERIIDQFKNDFSILGTLSEMRRKIKPPKASLVIKDKKTFAPVIIPDRIKIKQEKNYLEF
jgi:hypothetical protein